jgi:hypothetical protein
MNSNLPRGWPPVGHDHTGRPVHVRRAIAWAVTVRVRLFLSLVILPVILVRESWSAVALGLSVPLSLAVTCRMGGQRRFVRLS